MKGFVHSIESFGTVDGPGTRMVVFLQGCPLRCVYCHNPDTWQPKQGDTMTVAQILERFRDNRSFYETGGITVSGGEPLVQLPFVTALFEAAKRDGIHTALDTSGALFLDDRRTRLRFDRLLTVTDLVLLDIKHIDATAHRRLTGRDNHRVLAFAHYLDTKRIPVWIRHVLVPGWTDDAETLTQLGHFIGRLSCVRRFELLPYHALGEEKYRRLGMPYPLTGVASPDKEAVRRAKMLVLKGIADERHAAVKAVRSDR